ncbi:NUDIX hydrolase [Reichenbachiella versicolor]|uniref:NUDIX hydrolase n=1 Tax=Reichenbachiella versicolor TaxID=1821036 RepID=UPI000D6E6433|nr:NUDIX domain-containing protein [Reichenbachiella versicolor]
MEQKPTSRQVNWDTTVSIDAYECSHTADVAIFGFTQKGLKVLLVQRDIEPFKGHWLLPGGIMQEGQNLEEAVSTVLDKLLGLSSEVYIKQVKTYSNVRRHPIKRAITSGYYALVKPEWLEMRPKNYISDAKWVDFSDINELGFDHLEVLQDARNMLKQAVSFSKIGFHLLPEKFTLTELQGLYEILLDETLDRRNFRRKVNSLNMVLETKEKRKGVQGAPTLFKLNPNFQSNTNHSFR